MGFLRLARCRYADDPHVPWSGSSDVAYLDQDEARAFIEDEFAREAGP